MTIIILLILTGFLLLVLEFFVFPGITIAGIGGVILVGTGVYLGYANYGSGMGHIILGVTILAFAFVIGMALRTRTWNKLMLNTAITGQVETVSEETIHRGDQGIAITRLNPIGKVRVNDQDVEAHCPGQFVDAKSAVEVVKVFKTYIIVKPVN
jgi:membrane-bound ClpP family serine protease